MVVILRRRLEYHVAKSKQLCDSPVPARRLGTISEMVRLSLSATPLNAASLTFFCFRQLGDNATSTAPLSHLPDLNSPPLSDRITVAVRLVLFLRAVISCVIRVAVSYLLLSVLERDSQFVINEVGHER